MKKVFLSLLCLALLTNLKAQDNYKNYSLNFQLGYSNINYKNVAYALQTGFSLNIPTEHKINYVIGYEYMLGGAIKKDQLANNPQEFNYNAHIQQSQFNGLLSYPLVSKNKFKVNINTGISFVFLKQSFVNNIYEKLIVPNAPLVLVSESTFEKKFQVGSVSSLTSSFQFKKFSPGISLQYQIQREYHFFSPSLFISYQL